MPFRLIHLVYVSRVHVTPFDIAHPIGVYPSSLSHPKLACKPLWQSCPWLRPPENDRSRLSDSLVLFTTRSAIPPSLTLLPTDRISSPFNLVTRALQKQQFSFIVFPQRSLIERFWTLVSQINKRKFTFKMTVLVNFWNCLTVIECLECFCGCGTGKICSNWILQAWVRSCR